MKGRRTSLVEKLRTLDATTGKSAFASLVCSYIANHEQAASTRLAEFLASCEHALAHSLPLTEVCAAVNAQRVLRDLVTAIQLADAEIAAVKGLTQAMLLALAKEQSEAILRTLGTLMFYAHVQSLGLDEAIVTACTPYLTISDSPKRCRLAVECVANLLMRSNAALQSAKGALYSLFQLYAEKCTPDPQLKVSPMQMCTALARALHYVVPQDQLTDTDALALFFALRPLLYLGTPFAPEHLRFAQESDGSSSDVSESEARPRHAEKVKCYVLLCLKSLFQTHSAQLFTYWPHLFPDSQKGTVRERALKSPSLLYLLFEDKSAKVRVKAADTICGVLEHSPLSTWKGRADANKASFTSFSSEISQIITNLHDAVGDLISHEDSPQSAVSVLRLGECLMANTPYQTLHTGSLAPLCAASMKWLTHADAAVRQATLSLLSAGFSARPSDLQPLLASEVLLVTLFPQSLQEELLPERLALLSKVGKSLPQCLFDHTAWVKTTLPVFTTAADAKVSAQGFAVISEHMSANPASQLASWVLERWLEQLPSDSLDVLAPCFTALASFPSLSMMSDAQRKLLEGAVVQFQSRPVTVTNFKVALLKIVSRLIANSSDEFLLTLYDITFLYKADLNLSVALAVSQALVELASHPAISQRISEFVDCLIDRSENKKEKIVSAAVTALGVVGISQGFSQLAESHLQRLFQVVIRNVGHKNAKVGWDACDSLLLLMNAPDFRGFQVHTTVLPALLGYIESHHNYKTRISCCQMLSSLKPEVSCELCLTVGRLLTALEADLTHEAEDFAQGKHQNSFRLTVAQIIVEMLTGLSQDAEGLAEFLNTFTPVVLEAIKTVLAEAAKAGETLNSVSQTCKEAARRVHALVEADPEVHVSFATVERLEELSRLDKSSLTWVLGYSDAPEDYNIGLKSVRTPNSPRHTSEVRF